MAKLSTPVLASGHSAERASPEGTRPDNANRSRPHLYEIDVVRAVTALCVVGVHTVAFTVILLPPNGVGANVQGAIEHALHFTREMFLAITAFVMVYSYAANRPFSVRTFWWKRGLGVLLPYII